MASITYSSRNLGLELGVQFAIWSDVFRLKKKKKIASDRNSTLICLVPKNDKPGTIT